MGMFDWYEPQPAIACPRCGCALDGWQGKDGPCALFLWVQGHPGPRDQLVDDECKISVEQRHAWRLPEGFRFYTACDACGLWLDYTGFCEKGVWVRSIAGPVLRAVPISATRVSPGWRQCSGCTEAWEEADSVELSGCPSCGALTKAPGA